MHTEMYIGREENGDKKKLFKTCGTILWVLMICIVVFFTSYSL